MRINLNFYMEWYFGNCHHIIIQHLFKNTYQEFLYSMTEKNKFASISNVVKIIRIV